MAEEIGGAGESAKARPHPAMVNKGKHIEDLKKSVEKARATPGTPQWHKDKVEKQKSSISPKQY